MNLQEISTYCADYIRREDKDRYVLSLFAPSEHRAALWALFAFNAEIAKTREVVTETSLGLMRLLWWREGVQEIYQGACRDHPVLLGLKEAIERYDLPLKLFEDMTYGREFDLEDVVPGNIDGLFNYCDFTHTPLLKLCDQIVGMEEELSLKKLAIRYSIAGILRSFVAHAHQHRCYLPQDLMEEANLAEAQMYELKNLEGLEKIAQKLLETLPDAPEFDAKFFKAYNGLASIYLKHIKGVKFDLLDYRLTLPPLLKELRLWKAATF